MSDATFLHRELRHLSAFSIPQPWAWLVVHGFRDCENRSWKPLNSDIDFRGAFLVHTGKRFDREGWEFVRDTYPDVPMPAALAFDQNRGGIVGRAVITDVVLEHSSRWFRGPYAFLIADGAPLPFLPCQGGQGFFKPRLPPPAPVERTPGQMRFL